MRIIIINNANKWGGSPSEEHHNLILDHNMNLFTNPLPSSPIVTIAIAFTWIIIHNAHINPNFQSPFCVEKKMQKNKRKRKKKKEKRGGKTGDTEPSRKRRGKVETRKESFYEEAKTEKCKSKGF